MKMIFDEVNSVFSFSTLKKEEEEFESSCKHDHLLYFKSHR